MAYVVQWYDAHFAELTTMEVADIETAHYIRDKHSNATIRVIGSSADK